MIVRKKTSVHEKTVQKVARGEIKRQTKPRVVTRKRNSKVNVQVIDPMLKSWIKENHVSADRIKIVSTKSIIVLNPKG